MKRLQPEAKNFHAITRWNNGVLFRTYKYLNQKSGIYILKVYQNLRNKMFHVCRNDIVISSANDI